MDTDADVHDLLALTLVVCITVFKATLYDYNLSVLDVHAMSAICLSSLPEKNVERSAHRGRKLNLLLNLLADFHWFVDSILKIVGSVIGAYCPSSSSKRRVRNQIKIVRKVPKEG